MKSATDSITGKKPARPFAEHQTPCAPCPTLDYLPSRFKVIRQIRTTKLSAEPATPWFAPWLAEYLHVEMSADATFSDRHHGCGYAGQPGIWLGIEGGANARGSTITLPLEAR